MKDLWRDEWNDPLVFENALVLSTTAAAFGLMPPTVHELAIEPGERAVTLHFVIPEPDGSEDEDIDDMICELENLMREAVFVSTRIHRESLDWRDRQLRAIYGVRRSTD